MNNTINEASQSGSVLKRLLQNRKPGTLEALAMGFLAAQTIYEGVKKVKQQRIERRTVTLRFSEGSDEYAWLCRWIAKQPRIESESVGRAFSVKHLNARSHFNAPISVSDSPASGESDAWSLIPDNLQGFRFEDLVIGISREEPKTDRSEMYVTRAVVLSVITSDMGAVDRLLAAIHHAGNEASLIPHIPRVMALTTWGDWTEVRKAPANRTPVLPEGILESLMADVKWFVENENWYHSVGVPYRRGYLFHGIPGSGKTTTAISLASQFNRDIYVLPLGGMSDDKLMQAIRNAGRDGVLVIEDIDCATVSNERETQAATNGKDAPTLMGLLNAIDGVATPEGRILIATTNRVEVLDKALVRPGRFDRQYRFASADYHQILELCRRFGLSGESEATAKKWHAENLSMATVQQRLIAECGLGSK